MVGGKSSTLDHQTRRQMSKASKRKKAEDSPAEKKQRLEAVSLDELQRRFDGVRHADLAMGGKRAKPEERDRLFNELVLGRASGDAGPYALVCKAVRVELDPA